jgi:hypothetical protein
MQLVGKLSQTRTFAFSLLRPGVHTHTDLQLHCVGERKQGEKPGWN